MGCTTSKQTPAAPSSLKGEPQPKTLLTTRAAASPSCDAVFQVDAGVDIIEIDNTPMEVPAIQMNTLEPLAGADPSSDDTAHESQYQQIQHRNEADALISALAKDSKMADVASQCIGQNVPMKKDPQRESETMAVKQKPVSTNWPTTKELDQKYSAVSTQWPTAEETAAAGRIRDAHKATIARLKDPARDVVGDLRIVRFLRARHGSEEEASKWFGEFLCNRIECPEVEEQIRPSIIGRSPEEFVAWWQERVHPSFVMHPWVGVSPDGFGVFMARPGKIDGTKFTEERGGKTLDQERLLIIAMLEWTLWHLDEESHRRQQMLYVVKIMDFSGLGSEGRKLPLFIPKMKEFATSLVSIMQKPYCEHDAMFVMLNTPFVFRMVFNVISLLLTARQKAKITLLGNTSDPSVRKKLFEIVPPGMLPRELGGELQSIQGVYPPQEGSETQAWIQRMQTLELFPARQC